MVDKKRIIHSQDNTKPIPSCSLNKYELRKFISVLVEKSEKSASVEVSNIYPLDGEENQNFQRRIDRIKESMKLTVVIEGLNGVKKTSDDISILEDSSVPREIKSIVIENGFLHRLWYSGNDPKHYFHVFIDLSRPSRFDFKNPSHHPTPNGSCYRISSLDDDWFRSVESVMDDFFKSHSNVFFLQWLHRAFFYDVILWIFVVPILTIFVSNYENVIDLFFVSEIVNFFVYFYIFLSVAVFYKVVFSYTKWVWPKVTIEGFLDPSKGHRVMWGALAIGFIGSLIAGAFF
ncbi:MAG: hypothetical protein RLN96_03630 [Pseudomonadales bacterium]